MTAGNTMEKKFVHVFAHMGDEGFVVAGTLCVEFLFGESSKGVFQYHEAYLRRPDAFPLDPVALPLPMPGTQEAFDTRGNFGIFAGLTDAAPDRWGRSVLDRFSEDELTELDYLTASGSGRAGALAFGQSSEDFTPFLCGFRFPSRYFPFDMGKAAKFAYDPDSYVPGKFPSYAAIDAMCGLGGARPKASVTVGGVEKLAKFTKRTDEHRLLRLEYATMRLASECGFDVPDVEMTEIDGREIYLIDRFDRVPGDNGMTHRVPFVSAYTLVGVEDDMTAHHYGYADIVEGIRKYAPVSLVQRQVSKLYRRVAFNVMSGNDDDHLRNHGFLYDGSAWVLSPCYDILPKFQMSDERRTALYLGKHGREASIENLLSAAADFGLSRDEASAILKDLKSDISTKWRDVYQSSGLTDDEIGMVEGFFAQADRPFDFDVKTFGV